jgi:hypothetical protein
VRRNRGLRGQLVESHQPGGLAGDLGHGVVVEHYGSELDDSHKDQHENRKQKCKFNCRVSAFIPPKALASFPKYNNNAKN